MSKCSRFYGMLVWVLRHTQCVLEYYKLWLIAFDVIPNKHNGKRHAPRTDIPSNVSVLQEGSRNNRNTKYPCLQYPSTSSLLDRPVKCILSYLQFGAMLPN